MMKGSVATRPTWLSTSEILGVAAMIMGLTGGLLQMRKTHTSENVSSFSIWYLVLALISEVVLAVQGAMKDSPTLVIMRTASASYFLWFVWMFARRASGAASKKDDSSDADDPNASAALDAYADALDTSALPRVD